MFFFFFFFYRKKYNNNKCECSNMQKPVYQFSLDWMEYQDVVILQNVKPRSSKLSQTDDLGESNASHVPLLFELSKFTPSWEDKPDQQFYRTKTRLVFASRTRSEQKSRDWWKWSTANPEGEHDALRLKKKKELFFFFSGFDQYEFKLYFNV